MMGVMHRDTPGAADADRRARILWHLRRVGVATRRELARSTGLQPATLHRHVAALLDRGVVEACAERTPGRPGRPGALLAIRPDHALVVGHEVRRDGIRSVLSDAAGGLRRVESTGASLGTWVAADVISAITAATDDLLGDVHREGLPVIAVGVALPGVVDRRGTWWPPTRGPHPPIEIRRMAAARLDRFVVAEDVARAYAAAEHQIASPRSRGSDALYVFLEGAGLGAGVVIDDALVVRERGIFGEVGHVVVEHGGPPCRCGGSGCLEGLLDPTALRARWQAIGQDRDDGSGASPPPETLADAFAAARLGDARSARFTATLVPAFARALGAAVNLLGTTSIILGGDLRRADDSFVGSLQATLRAHVVPHLAALVSLRVGSLPPYASAWGAAIRARDEGITTGVLA